MIYSDILQSIKTLADVDEISFVINTLLKSVFKTKDKSFEKNLETISVRIADNLRRSLAVNKISLEDAKMVQEFLKGLQEKIHGLEVIKISLAFYPSQQTLDVIFSWILKNLGFGVIIDIQKDEKLLAGAVINFRGRYKDYSLRKKLNEIFVNRRQELAL